jgi:uncharacterized membrane protein YfcA
VRSIHEANGAKNVLAGVANSSAAIVFILGGQVVWTAAAVLAVSSLFGGGIGGRVTRQMPAAALRSLVIVVGLIAAGSAFVRG